MRYAAMTLILGVAFAPFLSAQESTARLLGAVTDPTGAVIPAASVSARNIATGLERKTVANESGNYSIPSLPRKKYSRYDVYNRITAGRQIRLPQRAGIAPCHFAVFLLKPGSRLASRNRALRLTPIILTALYTWFAF